MGAGTGSETRAGDETVNKGIVPVPGSTGRYRTDCQPRPCGNFTDSPLSSTGNRADACSRCYRAQGQVVCRAAGKVGWALCQTPTPLAGLARLPGGRHETDKRVTIALRLRVQGLVPTRRPSA